MRWRQCALRIPANVLNFLPHAEVANYELIVVDSNPYNCHFRTAVRIDGAQMGQRARC